MDIGSAANAPVPTELSMPFIVSFWKEKTYRSQDAVIIKRNCQILHDLACISVALHRTLRLSHSPPWIERPSTENLKYNAAEVPRSLSFAIILSFSCASFSTVNMKLSDLISLEKGVFQLEAGHSPWQPERSDAVVIGFAGSEIELAARSFEDDEEVL